MAGETNLSILIKEMTPRLNEGEYVFSMVKDLRHLDKDDAICVFKEAEGITVIIEKKKADKLHLVYDFVARWITLEIHSSLHAVGLTAVFSTELANNNISCNVIAGYYHDHLFIADKDAENALQVLVELSKNYN